MMQPQYSAQLDSDLLRQTILRWARESSIEFNVQDAKHLHASREFLPEGQRLYVSHLPKQTWEETLQACREVHAAGFEAIPHVPVRLLPDRGALDRFLEIAVRDAAVREVLLISGDYPQSVGPYSAVADVLRTGVLGHYGLKRVSLAGHPEGHPKVAVEEIRRAEAEKTAVARAQGLDAALVTQFFFAAQPFVTWAAEARAAGVGSRIIAGLCGPARIATLLKYAVRCGVGPSIRALGARPSSMMKLITDYGPEEVLSQLAQSFVQSAPDFDGLHLFCFGGFLRSCEWLQQLAAGRFTLDAQANLQID